jgi:hypothetical protein
MVDKTRFVQPVRLVHPLGWNCENCFHVVKDPTPGSKQMKCCRNPPVPQFAQMGAGSAVIAISPPVQAGEWCGEFISLPKVLSSCPDAN